MVITQGEALGQEFRDKGLEQDTVKNRSSELFLSFNCFDTLSSVGVTVGGGSIPFVTQYIMNGNLAICSDPFLLYVLTALSH